MEEFTLYTDLLNGEENGVPLEDLTDHQSPIGDTSQASQVDKKKGKNFNEDEDRLLVAAWLNISTDGKCGTNQSKASFWTRVHNFYMNHRETLAERSQNSLSHRWAAIQDAVSKFCGFLSQVETRNRSGSTIHDKMDEAEKMFKVFVKKPFQFRHCWVKLRNQPKWIERLRFLEELKRSAKQRKASTDSSPPANDYTQVDKSTHESSDVVTPEIPPKHSEAQKRPIGKKKAKAVLRRGDNDACIQALDNLWEKKKESDLEKEIKKDERYAKAFALDKERLEIEQKRLANEEKRLANEQERIVNEANNLRIKTMVEEERIMNLDVSSMNDLQKNYYWSLQAEIVGRRMNNPK